MSWILSYLIKLISWSALALHHFIRRRIEFAAILQSSNTAISPGRYFRLMAFAVVEIIWDSGANLYILWFNITSAGLRPWINWENVHSNFSRVAVFPAFILPQKFVAQVIWQWWIVPISSIMVFVFFGFGEEAMSDYYSSIVWFRRKVFRHQVNARPSDNLAMLPNHRSVFFTHPFSALSWLSDLETLVKVLVAISVYLFPDLRMKKRDGVFLLPKSRTHCHMHCRHPLPQPSLQPTIDSTTMVLQSPWRITHQRNHLSHRRLTKALTTPLLLVSQSRSRSRLCHHRVTSEPLKLLYPIHQR